MQILSLDSLVAQRDELRAEAEATRAKLDSLLKDLDEIETAEAMVRKFGKEQPATAGERVVPFRRKDELPLPESPPRPATDPARLSKRDLIIRILTESPSPWMTASEITRKAGAMTGKPTKRHNISPKLSDMKNAGDIVRDDSGMKVALASRIKEGAAVVAAGP